MGTNRTLMQFYDNPCGSVFTSECKLRYTFTCENGPFQMANNRVENMGQITAVLSSESLVKGSGRKNDGANIKER